MIDAGNLTLAVLVGGCVAAMTDERGGDVEILRFLAAADDGPIGAMARETMIATARRVTDSAREPAPCWPAGGWEAALEGANETRRRAVEDLAASPARPLIFLRRLPTFGAVVVEEAADRPGLWIVEAFDDTGRRTGCIEAQPFAGAVRDVLFFRADPLTATERGR